MTYQVFAGHRATALISEMTAAGFTLLTRDNGTFTVQGTPEQMHRFIENFREGLDIPPIYGTV